MKFSFFFSSYFQSREIVRRVCTVTPSRLIAPENLEEQTTITTFDYVARMKNGIASTFRLQMNPHVAKGMERGTAIFGVLVKYNFTILKTPL